MQACRAQRQNGGSRALPRPTAITQRDCRSNSLVPLADEDGDLARWKHLQGGHKGQRDGFALLVAGLRPERPADGALKERVRKRLQPGGLIARRRHGRFEPRHIPLPDRAPARPAARVQAPVGGDLVQPGAQRRAFLSEPADALPGSQHRLLDGVLGVGEGAEHPVAVHLQLPPVGLGQLPERLSIPGPRP
jgi:hypothetical protein